MDGSPVRTTSVPASVNGLIAMAGGTEVPVGTSDFSTLVGRFEARGHTWTELSGGSHRVRVTGFSLVFARHA